jgi:glycosyltransferase involved in cell wall biosynthesis
MEGISCVIITKNEEKNIDRCLKSLQGVVDEIIIIDSFSTDNTKEICRNYNTQFIQTDWKGYSETKNYGNSLATFSYILSIDADEALSKELAKELVNLRNSGRLLADAYYFNRLTNYCGKWIRHCGWYPDSKLRLFKKEKGRWEGVIHEQINMAEDSSITSLKHDLLHYSYYSINEHLYQMIRFTDLMALDYFNKGKKPTILKIIISPLIKFLKSYILQAGFLDGYYGFIICILSSCATFLKYVKTREIFLKNNIEDSSR